MLSGRKGLRRGQKYDRIGRKGHRVGRKWRERPRKWRRPSVKVLTGRGAIHRPPMHR